MSLSLSSRVLLQVGLLMVAATGLTTALIYRDTVHDVRESTSRNLRQMVAARAELDAQPFQFAQDNTVRLRDAWLQRLRVLGDVDPQAEFDAWLVKGDDGVTRVRAERDDHRRLPSVGLWVGARQDAALRRQVVTAFELLREWGPLLTQRYHSAYITLPGPGGAMDAPSVNLRPLADSTSLRIGP